MQCLKRASVFLLAALIWLTPGPAQAQAINPLIAPSAAPQQAVEPAPDAMLEEALRPIIRRVLAEQTAADAPSAALDAAAAGLVATTENAKPVKLSDEP